MRKILLLALVFVTSFTAFGQDFSNKGKEFWFCFPSHVPSGAALGRLQVWITSDLASSGTVSVTNGSFSAPFTVAANSITSVEIPYTAAHISNGESGMVLQKSIRLQVAAGQPPVVAYLQQFAAARSAATLLLPTSVLGRKYLTTSFFQNGTGRSQFQIIATKPNTNVVITPRNNGTLQPVINVPLPNVGDMYQYQSTQDISGSLIESVAGGIGGCNPIAVFSGSSGTSFAIFGCNAGNSVDPLLQQLYPITTWGKNFGFIPFGDYPNGNPYRIMAAEDNTTISINGAVVATLNAGDIYPNNYGSANPIVLTQISSITADKPIAVSQYAQRNPCSGSGHGDPDMVILNPIEQNIKDITIFTSTQEFINRQWINVLIPTVSAASFKIDGIAPITPFQVAANIPGYSYLIHQFSPAFNGPRIITADSGFNAICYGFQAGNFESYAYSAGSNVRDLSKELEIETTYGIETSPSVCTNAPFKFKFYIPDSSQGTPPIAIRFDSLRWDLSNPSLIVPNNFPIMVYPPCGPPCTVTYDSITIKNGKRVTWYSLPTTYYFNAPGNDTLLVTGYTSTNEGCGTDKLYDFPIVISDPPTASFTAPAPGCFLEPVIVTETTPQTPKTTYKLWWEFFDPVTNVTTVYSGIGNAFRTISHTFTTPGVKQIRHASITTPGCLSDTIVESVTLPQIPNATIAGGSTVCINTLPEPSMTFTAIDGRAPYIFTYNIDNGTGPGPNIDLPSPTANITLNVPTTTAGTFTYNLVGIRNDLPVGTPCTRAISGQSVVFTITPDATVTLTSAATTNNQTVCVNNNIVNITYAIGGSGNGGTVTGLPAGVTGTYAGGVVTITGAPTTAIGSPFTYTINPTGPCAFPIPAVTGTITVDDDATIALTSAVGTDNQTKCINTAITDIDYLVAGGGTGATIAWTPSVPPGITFTPLGGNNFRISGTPTSTAGSPYSYTISTTGPCIKPTAAGTLTVTPDATVTLTSAATTNNQTVCVNNNIVNITYAIGGSGNGGTVTGLPAGVTGTYAGGVVTITGAPTTAIGSPFTYTINPTGPCAFPIPAVTGTITVDDDATIALTSAVGTDNQTKCINTAITDIDYLVAGGGTGATIAWTPSVPPGITFTPLGGNNFRISGTPTSAAGSPYSYTISTTGPCIKPTAAGTLTVTPDATVTLTSAPPTNNQTVCINTNITNITYSIAGSGNGGTVTGLPPGVTGTYAGGVITITGAPTTAVGSPFTYTINPTGPCAFPIPAITGTITVTEDATISLTSGSNNQTVCRNIAIGDIDYATAGSATGATIAWVPSVPTGITFTPLGGGNFRIAGTPTVVGTQTYTYTISTTGPCIKPTATGTITVNALPVAAFTPSALRCANQDITFTNTSTPNAAGTTTYDWTFNDPNASGPNPNNVTTNTASPNTSHFFLVPNPYSVTMIATNSNGCISDPIASVNVIVNDTPRAGFIVPDVCINDVATIFTDTSKIASGTINRPFNEWNYGDGPPAAPSNNSIGINGSHLYPAPNFYDVRQIVTANITGCRDTITQRIIINSADPVSNFTPTNSCSSDSVDLRNLSTVGFGNVTQLRIYWDFIGAPGTFETISAPSFNAIYRHKYPTLQTTQTYTIRMIAYSGVVCSNTSTKTVTVYATPVVQFNNMPATCYLVAPYLLTQGSEIGGVPGIGTYSGPGIINPNGTFSPQVAGIGTHDIKYTWTASNPGACIDTLTRTITVIDTAHATFSVALPSCEQIPTSFTNLSTAPAGVTLVSTVWNFGDATGPQTFAIAAPITHLYAGPGPYTVTMHNVSDNLPVGCLSTDTSMDINIDANHGIALTSANNNQTRCVNVAIQNITYQLSNGANNIIMPPAGLPPGVTATLTGNVVTIAGAATTAVGSPFTYSITTLGNTCKDTTVSGVITVQPDHTISYKSGDTTQSVCINTPIDPIVYDLGGGANTAVASGLPAGVTGVATAGNTFTISGTPTSYVGSPFSFTILTGGNGCVQANAIGEIAVHPYPVPGFTVDKPSYCIPNAIVKFTNTSTTPDGSGMTYLWDFGDGSPQVNSFGPTHWYTSGVGPFTVRLSVTSVPIPILSNGQPGCNSFIDVPMTTIHPQPKADFVFSKPSVCIGDNVTITDATDNKDGLPSQWNWDMGDGGKRVTNPVTYTYADTISYTITFYSVNTFGCNSDTISKPFSVYPYPLVNAGPDKFVLEGGSVELEASAFARQPIYAWTPVEFLTDSKILRPRVVSPRTDMTYRLTVTGRGGCQFSNDVFVKLLKFPVIPNTFTPNGDGINDQWRIDYLNSYPDNRVQIFTRAGKLVFESKGYTTPWDGSLKGKPLPFDTYYYIIEPGNGRDPVTGYVTIIK